MSVSILLMVHSVCLNCVDLYPTGLYASLQITRVFDDPDCLRSKIFELCEAESDLVADLACVELPVLVNAQVLDERDISDSGALSIVSYRLAS